MKTLMLVLALALGSEGPLEFHVTLSLPRTTTERALKILSRESGAKIEINIKELAKQGITKNQSIGIEVERMTARKALLKILEKTDPKGRLTYYVNDEGTVIVTTIQDKNSDGQAEE